MLLQNMIRVIGITAAFLSCEAALHRVRFMDQNWTIEDVGAAATQGWRMVILWDEKSQRPEYEIRTTGKSFSKTDEAAVVMVNQLAARGDKLAQKATALVFQSKTGSLRPEPRKRAARA